MKSQEDWLLKCFVWRLPWALFDFNSTSLLINLPPWWIEILISSDSRVCWQIWSFYPKKAMADVLVNLFVTFITSPHLNHALHFFQFHVWFSKKVTLTLTLTSVPNTSESGSALFHAEKRQKAPQIFSLKRATILVKGATIWDIFYLAWN